VWTPYLAAIAGRSTAASVAASQSHDIAIAGILTEGVPVSHGTSPMSNAIQSGGIHKLAPPVKLGMTMVAMSITRFELPVQWQRNTARYAVKNCQPAEDHTKSFN